MYNLLKLAVLSVPFHEELAQCRVGLGVSVSASHTVGRGFASWPGHTKYNLKNGTNCLPA